MTGLLDRVLAQDRRAVARAATLLEAGQGGDLLHELGAHTGHALIVGITGPPGAGKSTFTDCVVETIRLEGKTVAVVAVDPSSAKSGGALLGDRIRMNRHHDDAGVFIRSMATRGTMGGIAAATQALTKVFDAAKFDVILIETVGVGQDEIEVARIAHCVVVLLVPGQGDEIQAIKAGIMEAADLFVINKADQPGVERLFHEIENETHAPIFKTVASEGTGVAEVWQAIQKLPRREVAAKASFAIDHIGIAVANIDEALRFYEDALGMRVEARETVTSEKVNVAMLAAGASRLELLEPSDASSTVGRFLEKRGGGLHHIALRVPNLEAMAEKLKARGARLLNEPRLGAGGHRYVFIHPASSGGVLLELIEETS